MLHRLSFGTTNVKLVDQFTATFSLPAGYTCPGAKDCHAWFNREEGKLYDGKHQEFRCYAAMSEAYLPSVRNAVDRNLRMLKEARSVERMATLIDLSLPGDFFKFIRVHQNGDFFSGDYFLAWMEVARRNPKRGFYAYTKSIPTWIRYRELVPPNFVLTASLGGKFDNLVAKHELRAAQVVFHPEEAKALGLKIDKTDALARNPKHGNFALLIHSSQPKGSKASDAMKRLKLEGVEFSYSRVSKANLSKLGPNKRPPAKQPGPRRRSKL